jgi:hypothetical protein
MKTAKKFAGVNTNVQIGSITLHVQTENFPRDLLLITSVYLDGACIHSVKWSYANHVGKPSFELKLQKAVELQQKNVVQRVPEIWAAYIAPKFPEPPITQIRSIRPSAVGSVELSEAVRDRIDQLYILAMRVRKSSPETAVLIWHEVLTLNPNHQLTIQKLKLLEIAA